MIFKKHVVILLSLVHSIKSMDTWDQIDLRLQESQRAHIFENNASVNPNLSIRDMFQTIIDDSHRNVKAVYTRNNPPPYQEGTLKSLISMEFFLILFEIIFPTTCLIRTSKFINF